MNTDNENISFISYVTDDGVLVYITYQVEPTPPPFNVTDRISEYIARLSDEMNADKTSFVLLDQDFTPGEGTRTLDTTETWFIPRNQGAVLATQYDESPKHEG